MLGPQIYYKKDIMEKSFQRSNALAYSVWKKIRPLSVCDSEKGYDFVKSLVFHFKNFFVSEDCPWGELLVWSIQPNLQIVVERNTLAYFIRDQWQTQANHVSVPFWKGLPFCQMLFYLVTILWVISEC